MAKPGHRVVSNLMPDSTVVELQQLDVCPADWPSTAIELHKFNATGHPVAAEPDIERVQLKDRVGHQPMILKQRFHFLIKHFKKQDAWGDGCVPEFRLPSASGLP
ncbi:hypothetical protein PCANC_18199 [Puccinia coronata f. sp. avenae]|uniref:Uncharacterized protein n=1 Tax=Puccinia coronata f. sp. avenae TaxID=200324 RepID=A0A2N5SJV3_9BASI|nr:hypothetical protein PCANC_18199 [Puccinia coronata f. sp. avenae]